MPDVQLIPGTLLVAPPALLDPNFRRATVLLCDHNEEGSFGLVINRVLDAEPSDVLEGIENYSGRLSFGGPVQADTLHYLHLHGDDVPTAIRVMDDVHWGGSFDTIRDLIDTFQSTAQTLRFFLGYAGWGPGQLEEEIEQGGWIISQAIAEDIFTEAPDTLWRHVLRRMGGEYAVLSNFPDDPRMN